jgi:hypothetical protein
MEYRHEYQRHHWGEHCLATACDSFNPTQKHHHRAGIFDNRVLDRRDGFTLFLG